jgi:hypothetical protein
LGEADHVSGVQLLGEIHHIVRVILLVTDTSASEKGTEGVNSYLVAFLPTPRLVLIAETTHH